MLPPLREIRSVSRHIARAVALQAQREGVADPCPPEELDERLDRTMWKPEYRKMTRAR